MSSRPLESVPVQVRSLLRPVTATAVDRAHAAPAPAGVKLPPELQQGFERELRCSMRLTQTPREAASDAARLFAEQLAEKASDARAFHELMKTVYGPGYDAKAAEEYRRRALTGDFSWLPPIQWVDRSTLQGAHGAYNSADNVVYLAKDLLHDPQRAAAVYAEECGHFLDTKLCRRDTPGDEGELFRRLLAGETLSGAQLAAIRAENDRGVIVVDGRRVEVEFWNPFKAIGKAFKSVGKAIGGAVQSVGRAIGGVGQGIASFTSGRVGGLARGAGGFFSNLVRGRFADAFGALGRGLDDAFLKAPFSLFAHIADALKDLCDAPTYLLGPLGKPLRALNARVHGVLRTVGDTAFGVTAGILRSLAEGGRDFDRGLGALLRGDLDGAWRHFKRSVVQTLINTPANALILGLGGGVSAIQTLLGLEKPGRTLTAAEIAKLRAIYGDAIDYDQVRIKTGNAGLFSLNDRPFVLGNTIYMKDSDLGGATLVHELVHVWQYQNGGSDYLGEALWSQEYGKGYDWQQSVPGTPWAELEPEQQAAFIEALYRAGYFNPQSPGFGRFSADVDGDGRAEDLTAYAHRAVTELRAGRGAP